MSSQIQAGVSQVNNDTWLSLRNLRDGVEDMGNMIHLTGNSPLEILKPGSWTYGYVEIRVGLQNSGSSDVTVTTWDDGGSSGTSVINTTLTNSSGGFQVLSAQSATAVISEATESFAVTYTGAPIGVALVLLPARRV